MFYKLFSNARVYLFVAAILTLVALMSVAIYTYRGAKAVEERALIERAETIALSLDPREITFLAGDATDSNNPFYISLKRRFEKLREANMDVRFVYLAGKRPMRTNGSFDPTSNGAGANEVFLYLDSEPANSPDYSPPGQTYEEASQAFKEVFTTNLPTFEGPLRDRWGEWVSAFVPLDDPKFGKTIAVVGLDIKASEYRKRIAFAMAVPLLCIVLLFLLFLIGYTRRKKDEEMLSLKAEFLSIASHDLRSPIAGVVWAIQSLKINPAGIGDDLRVGKTLSKIEMTLTRVLESVQGVLDSARLMQSRSFVEKQSVDAATVMTEVIEVLDFTAAQRDVTVALEEHFPKHFLVKAAPDSLRHIFLNIIGNAIKYSHPTDTVMVRYSEKNGNSIVGVEDQGIGIPERDQGKIFSKYFRGGNVSDAVQKGTGLGLYFTKRLVEECGGRIWFVSQENIGTKFYVEIKKNYD